MSANKIQTKFHFQFFVNCILIYSSIRFEDQTVDFETKNFYEHNVFNFSFFPPKLALGGISGPQALFPKLYQHLKYLQALTFKMGLQRFHVYIFPLAYLSKDYTVSVSYPRMRRLGPPIRRSTPRSATKGLLMVRPSGSSPRCCCGSTATPTPPSWRPLARLSRIKAWCKVLQV